MFPKRICGLKQNAGIRTEMKVRDANPTHGKRTITQRRLGRHNRALTAMSQRGRCDLKLDRVIQRRSVVNAPPACSESIVSSTPSSAHESLSDAGPEL